MARHLEWIIHRDSFYNAQMCQIAIEKIKSYDDRVDVIDKNTRHVMSNIILYDESLVSAKYAAKLFGINGLTFLDCFKVRAYSPSCYMRDSTDEFLNADCVFMPMWQLKRNVEYFDDDTVVFIKSNAPIKNFTGRLFTKEELVEVGITEKYTDTDPKIYYYVVDDYGMVMISQFHDIEPVEYRFYIVGDKVSTFGVRSNDSSILNLDWYVQDADDMIKYANKIVANNSYCRDCVLDLAKIKYSGDIKIISMSPYKIADIYYGVDVNKYIEDLRNYQLQGQD